MDRSDPRRDALHDFLQNQGPPGEEIHQGSLLTGWVLVTAWVDDDGDHWLVKAHAAEIQAWTARGMLHEVLEGEWPEPE